MRKFALFGAAAILTTTLATPLMAQEATQEPGMIGFNYPNSRYLTGGYGVRTPYNSGRYPRMFAAPRVIEYDAPGVYVGGGRSASLSRRWIRMRMTDTSRIDARSV